MSTDTDVDVSDLTEFEFATPCQSDEDCDEGAVALLSVSHTADGCWGPPVTFCQQHLVRKLRGHEEWCSLGGTCAVCLGPVFPGLPRNTRIVRL